MKTSKTVLISKKNSNEPILFYTKLDDEELTDQTKNINLKYITVRIKNNNLHEVKIIIMIFTK